MRINFTLFSARIIFLLFLLFQTATIQAQKWNVVTESSHRTGVHMVNSSVGWVIGANGSINKTIDGGATWILQPTGINTILTHIYAVDANNAWVIGENGIILKTNDGSNWTVQQHGTSKFTSIFFINSLTGWVTAKGGTLLKTIDGGITWSALITGTTKDISSVYFLDALKGWAIMGGKLFATIDGGITWTTITVLGNFYSLSAVRFIDANTGWCTGGEGVFRTTDGGITWSHKRLGYTIYDIQFIDASTGWVAQAAGGGKNQICKTTDGGITWTAQPTGDSAYMYRVAVHDIHFNNANIGWAVGYTGAILKTTNGGASWVEVMNITLKSQNLGDVKFVNASTGWAAGNGGIWKTTDSGATWVHQIPGYQSFSDLAFANSSTGWAITSGGTKIFHTSDGGTNWIAQESGTTEVLNEVYAINEKVAYCVGGRGTIIKTIDGGVTWTSQISGITWGLGGGYFSNEMTGYAVGAYGTILKTTNGGNTWVSMSSGTDQHLQIISFINANVGWAIGYGITLKTSDGGNTWKVQSSDTKLNFLDVHFIDTIKGLAVGQNGLYKTIDGGVNWVHQPTPLTTNLSGIALPTDGYGIVVGTHGVVLRTEKLFEFPSRFNTIKVGAFVDENANGIKDAGEGLFTQFYSVHIQKANSDKVTILHIDKGTSDIGLDTGTYNIAIQLRSSYYNVSNVTSKQFIFPDYFNKDSVYFGFAPVPTKVDLSVDLLPLTFARPGFATSYRLTYRNKGTAFHAATLTFVKDPRLTLVGSSRAVSETRDDTLIWQLPTLYPLDGGDISLTFNVAAPPTTSIGDTLHMLASIREASDTDVNPLNNQAKVSQVVVGSYDPNDKSEMHNGQFFRKQLDEGQALKYLIRFQNTGTDTAFNIVIKDTLDAKLDWNSVAMIVASHPYQLKQEKEKLIWTFTNINLPDSNVNESASHGYIAFSVSPQKGLPVGNKITNKAAIYFDYNLPVVTNTVTTSIYADPPPNKAPTVYAGSDITITLPADRVLLSGNANDLDGTVTGYLWRKITGPASSTIVTPDKANTPITLLVAGRYEFELQVTDNAGLIAKDTVGVTVMAAPVEEEPIIWLDVQAHPNPVNKDDITIVGLEKDKRYTIVVKNVEGAIMKRIEVSHQKQVRLPLPQAAGIYFISITNISNERNKLLRIIKTK